MHTSWRRSKACLLWTHNLHLGNRSDADLRLAQLNEVLQDVARVDPACVPIMAGDLNLDASKPRVSETLARAGFTSSGFMSIL